MKKKAQLAGKFAFIAFVLGFWVVFIILANLVKFNTGVSFNTTMSQDSSGAQSLGLLDYFNSNSGFFTKLGFIFNLMTFQVTGVPTVFSIIIDFLTMLTLIALYAFVRGD